jgi:hypothetical protein
MRNVISGFMRLDRHRGGWATAGQNSRVWSLGKRTIGLLGLYLSSRGEGAANLDLKGNCSWKQRKRLTGGVERVEAEFGKLSW